MVILKILKHNFLIIFIFITPFLQFGCSTKNYNKKIIIASSGKIESIDPARANTLKALQLLNSLGDTLYELNHEGKLIPKLASSMPTISEDKLKITIKLKENVLFHDGTKFDSESMKFTIERFQNIGTMNYILGDRIKSIETEDKHTIVLNLNKPSSSLEGLLTSINLTPISPTSYRDYSDKFLNNKFIGTGKYILKNFSNEVQTLDPNLEYWGKKVKNKGISFVGFSNSASLFGALMSKQIDVLLSNSIDDSQRIKLSKLSEENIIKEGISYPTEISFISLRTNKAPLNNQKVRLAISKTLNRVLISEKVSYGLRKPSKSIIPSFLKQDKSINWPDYDPQKAVNILKEEGFCDNKTLNLSLTYRSNVPTDKLIALSWQQDVRENMGDCFKIDIIGLESTTIYKNLSNGIYPAVILDWTGAYSDPESYLTPLLSCNKIEGESCIEGESVFSGSFWGSKEVEDLLKESESLLGGKRLNKLLRIEAIAAKSLPYIPIWTSSQKAWAQKNISIPTFNAAGRILMGEFEVLDE